MMQPRNVKDRSAAAQTSSGRGGTHSEISNVALLQMDLATLTRHCIIESNHFYQRHAHDTRFAYELFRRALVERCEQAWSHIYQHYSPLVESWVRRSSAFASSGESSEFFVTSAFARFWRAVTAERFASFASLAALLQYLQLCATCVVIDSVRTQSWAEVLPEPMLVAAPDFGPAPDEEAVERVSREDFWRYVDALLNDESERAVIYDSFVLGLKPGAIYERRAALFSSVRDVYNTKRNVLERLGRNSELRRNYGYAVS